MSVIKDKIIMGMYSLGGLIGSIISKHGDIPYEEMFRAYGHDITGVFAAYFGYKMIEVFEKAEHGAIGLFLGCSLVELVQATGLYGTYDPKDFLAYAAGAGLALAVDKITFKKEGLESLV